MTFPFASLENPEILGTLTQFGYQELIALAVVGRGRRVREPGGRVPAGAFRMIPFGATCAARRPVEHHRRVIAVVRHPQLVVLRDRSRRRPGR